MLPAMLMLALQLGFGRDRLLLRPAVRTQELTHHAEHHDVDPARPKLDFRVLLHCGVREGHRCPAIRSVGSAPTNA